MKIWIGCAKRGRSILWAALVLAALIQCRDALPTTNPVVSIELAALDEVLSDQNFNGLVVVMASWCPPCREELPELVKLYRKYHGQGINIVAISIDADGPGAVQPLIDQYQVPFPVYWVGSKGIQQYKIVGIPTVLVVQKGAIIEKLPGLQPSRTLERKIKKLIP